MDFSKSHLLVSLILSYFPLSLSFLCSNFYNFFDFTLYLNFLSLSSCQKWKLGLLSLDLISFLIYAMLWPFLWALFLLWSVNVDLYFHLFQNTYKIVLRGFFFWSVLFRSMLYNLQVSNYWSVDWLISS